MKCMGKGCYLICYVGNKTEFEKNGSLEDILKKNYCCTMAYEAHCKWGKKNLEWVEKEGVKFCEKRININFRNFLEK